MRTIYLKNFGTVLVSRPAGREAFAAIRPTLKQGEPVQIDFSDILTVTPSWLDEFLTYLVQHLEGRVELLPTKNASVLASLPALAAERHDATANVVRRALKRMGVEE